MSYLIQYDPKNSKKYPQKQVKRKTERIILATILALLIFITGSVLRKNQNLFHWLIPGNAEVTSQAFEKLIVDLKDGESVKNAVSVFCQEIIENAEAEP